MGSYTGSSVTRVKLESVDWDFSRRIAIFTDTFYQVNGVAMVYNRFARWCAERGVSVEIFTPGDQPLLDMGSVRVHAVRMIAPIPYYSNLDFDLFPLRSSLIEYFDKRRFDMMHIATQGHVALQALHIAARHNMPKLSCYHTAIPEYAHSRFIQHLGDNKAGRFLADRIANLLWWYQRRLYHSSKLILVPTKSIKEMVEAETGIPTAFFTRGVDSDAFSPARRIEDKPNRPLTVYCGRISIEKNLDLAPRLSREEGRNMIFIGDGPYTSTLKEIMPEATFTGFINGDALHEAYASSDIFIFPSETDTFGNAVLEAMSSGLPVIVTDKMGPKDFVQHGKTGFIARDDDEFVKYHRLLEENVELRKEMGANARAFARTRSWDRIFETQLLGNYIKVLEEHERDND